MASVLLASPIKKWALS